MPPPRRAAAISAASNLAATASGSRVVSGSTGTGSAATVKGGKITNGAHEKQQASASTSASSKTAQANLTAPPPPAQPLSPIVSRLRKMWKFAALCQFLLTFDEAFGMSGFDTEALESDLDGTETRVIPDLMRRLLYTLTLNRAIDESNWEDHLRAQYVRREPDNDILGTAEAPVPWHGLPLPKKVETLHSACEWQLWDAERFRKLVKNEEDAEAWRIESVGWDANDNRYWLFDDNRLWIQHPPPPPPPPKALPKKSSKKAKAEARREAQQKRKRESSSATTSAAVTAQSTPRRAVVMRGLRTPPTRASPRNRASLGAGGGDSVSNGESANKRARVLRGQQTDDWEPVPASLLYDNSKDGGDADDDSDLSDPPEEEPDQDESMDATKHDANNTLTTDSGGVLREERPDESEADADPTQMDVDVKAEEKEGKVEEADLQDDGSVPDTAETTRVEEPKNEAKPATEVGEDEEPEWVEFETVAVTRAEWEWISTRFAKSKHPDEKALHAYLKEEVVPAVMNDLDEAEKQRAHEIAMANRKRSSRIALKESEREERERDRLARQRMEEKMAAIRDEEEAQARREREEVDAARTREERLREREERLLAREREVIERAQREAEERERRERMREWRKMKREQIIANGGHPAPSEDDESLDVDERDGLGGGRLEDDSWELGCEICGKRGVNLDESEELVCCETCGVWQHTECWNAFDRRVGRARRDWEVEDFFCSRCRPPAAGQPRPHGPVQQQQQQQPVHQVVHHGSQSQPLTQQVLSQTYAQRQQQVPQAQVQIPTSAPVPVIPLTDPPVKTQSPVMASAPVQQQEQEPRQHTIQQAADTAVQQVQSPSRGGAAPFQASNKAQFPATSAYSSIGSPSPFPPYTTIYGGYGTEDRTGKHISPPGPSYSLSRSGSSSSHANSPPANGATAHSPGLSGLASEAHSPLAVSQPPQRQSSERQAMSVAVPAQQNLAANGTGSAVQTTPLAMSASTSTGSQSASAVVNAPKSLSPSAAPVTTPSVPAIPLPSQNGSMGAPLSTLSRPTSSSVDLAALSQSNGTSVSSAGPSKPSMSPKQGMPIPVRSPGSGGSAPASSSLPRSMSSHASGSFPLRHTPVRSPLSGPHHSSPNSMPSVALPPPIRSSSPSPAARLPSHPQQNQARTPQLTHDLLHSRQAPPPVLSGVDAGSTLAAGTQSTASVASINSLAAGPGPSSGSLARVPSTQAPAAKQLPITSGNPSFHAAGAAPPPPSAGSSISASLMTPHATPSANPSDPSAQQQQSQQSQTLAPHQQQPPSAPSHAPS